MFRAGTPRAACRCAGDPDALAQPGGTITVVEGDHGSTYFYPESSDAHAAIRCQVTMQREVSGTALIGRQVYPLVVAAGFEDVLVSPRMGVCGRKPPRAGRRLHTTHLHHHARARRRCRKGQGHRSNAYITRNGSARFAASFQIRRRGITSPLAGSRVIWTKVKRSRLPNRSKVCGTSGVQVPVLK